MQRMNTYEAVKFPDSNECKKQRQNEELDEEKDESLTPKKNQIRINFR